MTNQWEAIWNIDWSIRVCTNNNTIVYKVHSTVCKHKPARESGGMPARNIFKVSCSEMQFGSILYLVGYSFYDDFFP